MVTDPFSRGRESRKYIVPFLSGIRTSFPGFPTRHLIKTTGSLRRETADIYM